MAIGTKRICTSCGAKFYDLDKEPIKCPKCASIFNPEAAAKPKRGRKKAGAKEQEEEIEISLDDEVVEELDDDAAVEEADEEIRDEMGVDEETTHHDKKGSKTLVDLEEESGDIIESDDGHSDKE